MDNIMVRVDEKLLHAQIMLKWVRYNNFKKIIVVDNDIAHSPFLVQVYKLAVPNHIKIEIISVEKFSNYFTSCNNDTKIMVIISSLETLSQILISGVTFTSVQIGYTSFSHLGKDTSYQLLSEEIERMGINNYKCDIYLQNNPEDSKRFLIKNKE